MLLSLDVEKSADRYEGQSESKYLRMLKSFPPGIMGMALGLCGGASIYLEFANIQKEGIIRLLSIILYQFHNAFAAFLLILFSLRMFVDLKKVKQEISTVNIIPPYASGQMAILFITGRVIIYMFGLEVAQVFVYIFAGVQMVLMLGFFYCCYQTSTYPEPFWNPPTVNLPLSFSLFL